jgi:nitroreductase
MAIPEAKRATTAHPIDALLTQRWSPYAFADRPVDEAVVRSLFEAARWAASSYNEQPWSYLVATAADAEAHARLLSCLVEGNRSWAAAAPVLALGVVTHPFTRNQKPNKAAVHDLGLASANLTVEATARGLVVHQMIGIEPERARDLYGIPAGSEAFTGLAIGFPAAAAALPEGLRARDEAPRARKPLSAFVFGERWGAPARLLGSG